MSEGQRQLARRCATAEINLETYGTLTDRLGRALSRLGLFRQAREVPLSPLEYARRLDLADDLDVEDA